MVTLRDNIGAMCQHRTGRRERLSSRTLARRRWLTECGAYLRSSAPPACGHAPGQHRGDVPAPHRTAGTAQQQNAGAAAVAD
ncbi:hypothetical protein RQM06_27000 [Citrobacter freundii]|nr:hypothetical protein [Citrobacter freundii]MDT7068218.1 hypothetical protein [Citrobacter freundii]MDT7083261.1 hypothetical protein [Citrobacter freundii]QMI78282.1 hypothetical protein H1014_24705 [Citrobacter freundii]QMI78283.1 hypothetical protein H1014_24710 [Citrobacter freundii]